MCFKYTRLDASDECIPSKATGSAVKHEFDPCDRTIHDQTLLTYLNIDSTIIQKMGEKISWWSCVSNARDCEQMVNALHLKGMTQRVP